MTPEGYLPISLITSFNRVQQLTKIRPLDDPESWPLSPELSECVPAAPAAGPHGGPAKDSTATAAAKKSAAAQDDGEDTAGTDGDDESKEDETGVNQEVEAALGASFNNPDRAVDHLLTGIPATAAADPSSAAASPAGAAAAQAGAKGFQDLPPEVIGKIIGFCSTADQKEMRCVSKWFFNMVSSASRKLESIFQTYTIKNIDESNYTQISEELSNAIMKSYGPKVRLDLQFNRASSDQMREILSNFIENIVSLYIPLWKDPEILLQPHLELTNIQRLDIDFPNVDYDLNKNMCEAILARYGDKLEHIGVNFFKIPNNTVLQVPHLSKLKSLALGVVDNNIVHTFVNSLNKENITHLSLRWITLDIEQLDNFIFPKLQHLELNNTSNESALVLIKCHKDTITKLKVGKVTFTHSDIGDIKIPNLQYLIIPGISGDVALALIKCNKDTITMLKLGLLKSGNCDIGDIKIPNLQYLSLCYTSSDNNALSFFKNNKDTLCELRLYRFNFENISLPVVEMPRLKRLYLKNGDATSELQFIRFIKAFGGNIEEILSYDYQKDTYIRKSREELNNLKTALALQ